VIPARPKPDDVAAMVTSSVAAMAPGWAAAGEGVMTGMPAHVVGHDHRRGARAQVPRHILRHHVDDVLASAEVEAMPSSLEHHLE
jgi:hypothetical protein